MTKDNKAQINMYNREANRDNDMDKDIDNDIGNDMDNDIDNDMDIEKDRGKDKKPRSATVPRAQKKQTEKPLWSLRLFFFAYSVFRY